MKQEDEKKKKKKNLRERERSHTMRKKCELCGDVARMYCESDQASLCWDCDQNVHGANFLVAKHTRCLLCTACHSPTPWKASGPRLSPTVSACDSCVSLRNNSGAGLNLSENRIPETNGHDHDEDRYDGVAESYDDDEEDVEDDEEYSDEDDDEEEEEAENQVVPWAAVLQPPILSSLSSISGGGGDEAFPRRCGGGGGLAAKRNSDLLYSDDEIGCSSSPHGSNSYRPSKRASRDDEDGETKYRSTAIIESVLRLHRDKSSDGDDLVLAISNMSRDHSR